MFTIKLQKLEISTSQKHATNNLQSGQLLTPKEANKRKKNKSPGPDTHLESVCASKENTVAQLAAANGTQDTVVRGS